MRALPQKNAGVWLALAVPRRSNQNLDMGACIRWLGRLDPALVITMVIFAGPIFRTLSGEKAWHAVGGSVGVAAFSFAVINTFLAPHLTAEGIRAASYRPGPDESYAKVETQYQLVLYFYLWMTVFIVVAVGSVVIALSRLRTMIETCISIRESGVHYWRYRFWPQDQRELNRALAFSLHNSSAPSFSLTVPPKRRSGLMKWKTAGAFTTLP